MRRSLVFLLTNWCLFSQAQQSFEKLYDCSGSMKLIELPGHYLLTGMDGGPGGTGATVIDATGEIVQTNSYLWGGPLLGLASFRDYSSNAFYFVSGYLSGTCNGGAQIDPVIGRMDSLGDISTLQYYTLNAGCGGLAAGLELTNDGGVVTWGWEYGFFALRADSNLVHKWSKHFDRNGSFQFIKELPSGDLLAGINMDTAGAVLARIDSEGNFIWCKSYMRPKGMVQDCLIESDTTFIITGYTDTIASTNGFTSLPQGYHPKLFMMKLNGMGEVQWCKGYENEPVWYTRRGLHIERTQDDKYVILANIGIQDHNLPNRPFLMKTDQNGDTIWTRTAGASGFTYSTSNLLAYSDKGFLYNGIVYGDLPGMNTGMRYIFKTDSLGHLPCSDYQPPSIIGSDLFPTDSSFTLTSVDGAVAFPVTVSDTIFDPITPYNGCIITSLPSFGAPVSKFQVYPNPNTGHLTLQFNDPLMAKSYYSVYDTMGRLLLQRPLPPGVTLAEVDLTRFSKGTYVIKFTDRDGVCFERVVLE